MPSDILRGGNGTTDAIVNDTWQVWIQNFSCQILSSLDVTWHLIPLRYSILMTLVQPCICSIIGLFQLFSVVLKPVRLEANPPAVDLPPSSRG